MGLPILPTNLTSFPCFLKTSYNSFDVVDFPLVPVMVIFLYLDDLNKIYQDL